MMNSVKMGPFRGINNRLPLERDRPLGDREPGSFLHDAVNVDLTPGGTLRRRPGRRRIGSLVGCRGLHTSQGVAYFAAQDRVYRLDQDEAPTEVGTVASPFAPVAFENTPVGLVMSDTFSMQVLQGSAFEPFVPAVPNPLPVVSASAGGVLPAGRYSLLFQAENEAGRRSAQSGVVYVDVPAGGAVAVTLSAPAAQTVVVFMTAQDGSIYYRVGEIAAGATTLSVLSNAAEREPVAYRATAPLPPGELLAYHKGRLYSAVAGVLHYSLPYNLGLQAPDEGYLWFPDPVAVVASVDEGLFVATTSETFFLPGGDPTKYEAAQLAPYGAVPKSAVYDPRAKEWMWHTPRGPVRTRGREIELLQDAAIAYSPAASGASIFREQNGLRSVISSLAGTIPTGAAVVGSYMDAEVITGA